MVWCGSSTACAPICCPPRRPPTRADPSLPPAARDDHPEYPEHPMSNTFAQIDHIASSGTTPWHGASAAGKLLMALTYVGLAVFTPSWAVLAMLLATLFTILTTARIPWKLIVAAAATPFLFSLIFVLAHLHGDWDEPLVLFMRPMLASFPAVWLVCTTPYPDRV